MVGAVAVLGGLFRFVVAPLYEPPVPPCLRQGMSCSPEAVERATEAYLSSYSLPGNHWGFYWSQSLTENTVRYVGEIVTSPFVWGPLLITGLVTLRFEYRRRTRSG